MQSNLFIVTVQSEFQEGGFATKTFKMYTKYLTCHNHTVVFDYIIVLFFYYMTLVQTWICVLAPLTMPY